MKFMQRNTCRFTKSFAFVLAVPLMLTSFVAFSKKFFSANLTTSGKLIPTKAQELIKRVKYIKYNIYQYIVRRTQLNATNFLNLKWIVLVYLFLFVTACENNQPSNNPTIKPQKSNFNELFNFEERVIIKGDSSTPVFTVWRPFIKEDNIYLSDSMGHVVLIYDKNGNLIKKLGGKGQGPGEFQIPYGVAIDKDKNLYVNDRQNYRVQIYDSTFKLIKEIKIPGQNETMFLGNNMNEDTNIVMVGQVTGKKGNYYLQKYDLNGKLIKKFALLNRYFWLASWAATQDYQGNIYLINSLENELYLFAPDGRKIRTMVLSSPTMKLINVNTKKRPRNRNEVINKTKLIRTLVHTRVEGIFIFNDFLFIFLRLKNDSTTEKIYYLDIYDLDGNLIYYGIEAPGWLHCVTEKFYFMNINEEVKYGTVEIMTFKFKQRF